MSHRVINRLPAASFTKTKSGDRLTAIHISDKSKPNLPACLLPRHLRSHYQDLATAARVPQEWVCREKDEGSSTCQVLTKLADKSMVDLLVLG